jgi:hypothetical protein
MHGTLLQELARVSVLGSARSEIATDGGVRVVERTIIYSSVARDDSLWTGFVGLAHGYDCLDEKAIPEQLMTPETRLI